MKSSVSCVASTAPWPGRAWSEWPCVISALSTGRSGSMWKPPGRQHRPAGVGTSRSCGRIALRYAIGRALEGQMTAPLFQSSGDLLADRRFVIAQEFLARGDLAGGADLLTQAIEAAPRFVSAWFALGE